MSISKVPKLYDELYKWIDRGPLVEAIIGSLWGNDLPLTRGQAKLVWYQALEELPGFLDRQAQRKRFYERSGERHEEIALSKTKGSSSVGKRKDLINILSSFVSVL